MPRRRKSTDQLAIDFGARQLEWPESTRFPYNDPPATVRDVVVRDIRESKSPLIITGYTSLEWIVDLLAGLSARRGGRQAELESLRLLIGNEPLLHYGRGSPLTKRAISQDIADYWLAQGISLRSCGKVLDALEFCEDERVLIRSSGSRSIHAKVYATENAVTIGSSNYSRAGMELQVEGNVRFSPSEQKRFKEATAYAENIWELGDDYKTGFVELLRELLQHVSWQEALGRACGELLEGDWLRTRLKVVDHGQLAQMWPSQEQGVAQAMWILENMGSVLVADATGSGKTRMGARLIRALLHHIVRTGRDRTGLPVLLTPPAVEDIWHSEAMENGVSVQTYSHGLLSRPDTKKGKLVGEAVRRAQILAVDEAHNFLSMTSVRTSRLHRNVADHALVATGESESSRARLIEKFALGSESGPAIALCSDAHAQSINLPAASAVVHLDFPTVPRLAEQRVGRVDRLDSPHAEVSVYYPDDHADFALRADEKFFERHHLVAELLGANIPLPELTRRLEAEKGRVIHAEDVDEEPSVGDESVSAWNDSRHRPRHDCDPAP